MTVTQENVSMAERRTVHLANVEPSAESLSTARRMSKGPRLVETIFVNRGGSSACGTIVIISETHHGLILRMRGSINPT